MIRKYLVTALRKAVARPLYRKFARFEAQCALGAQAQEQLLLQIVRQQEQTGFGIDHGFGQIRTVADFRRQIEVAPYERMDPYIRKVMAGDTQALIANSPLLMFALTSGTTAARKHIPITQAYLDDYKRGWNLWGLHALRKHKQCFLRPILQLAGDADEYRTSANIPCGNLSGFTAQVQKKIMRWMYVLPPQTGKIKEANARTYVAVRSALGKKLGMLMAANPSSLVNLARFIDQHKEALIRDIATGSLTSQVDIPDDIRQALSERWKPNPERAKELEGFANLHGQLLPKHAWPTDKLLIGCWTGGTVGPYLRQLPQFYGETPVRDLGLLASEGRMTIPIEDNTPAGVLDITSHYYEFIPENEIESPQPTVLGSHELVPGQHYFIILTTKAGLYRYHISDLVRVTGYFHQAPLIEFLGKGSRFSNMTGEKLTEYQVTQAVDAIVKTIPQPLTAYSLAPCWDEVNPHYGLFIEEQDARDLPLLQRFVQALDLQLKSTNIEYDAKRDSKRLGAIQFYLLPQGTWQAWDAAKVKANGGAPEQYKHPCLIGDLNFRNSVSATQGPKQAA